MPRACARSMICARLRCSSAAGRPRRPSLPPSATISTRTSPSSAQSSRDKPAGRRVAGDARVDDLVVEPGRVDALLQQRRDTRRRGGRPRPAVRLSPRTTMRGAVVAGVGAGTVDGSGQSSRPAGGAIRARDRPQAAERHNTATTITTARNALRTSQMLVFSWSRGRSGSDRHHPRASCSSSAAIASASIRRCAVAARDGEVRFRSRQRQLDRAASAPAPRAPRRQRAAAAVVPRSASAC